MAVEKLAEFGLDTGAQFLNNSLSNIIEPEKDVDNIDDNFLLNDDEYKDYSDTAIYALALKQKNPALIGFDLSLIHI